MPEARNECSPSELGGMYWREGVLLHAHWLSPSCRAGMGARAVAQWLEHQPANRGGAGLIPTPVRVQAGGNSRCVSFTAMLLCLSLSLSLSTGKNILGSALVSLLVGVTHDLG